MKPYNYGRGLMIQKICLFLVLWCILLDSIFSFVDEEIAAISIFFAGILAIGAVGGVLLIKIEDVFISPKRSNVSKRLRAYIYSGSIDYENGSCYVESERDVTVFEDKSKGTISNIVTSQQAELGGK